MPAADSAKIQLIQDRRKLLEHALHVFTRQQGGRLQLPIGMNSAEPWLLDSVDVEAFLGALSQAVADRIGSKGPTLDLLSYCQKGTRTVTVDSTAHSRASSRRTSDAAGLDAEAPQLQLPQLQTGLTEGEVKDLAYLVFACNCPHEGDLLDSVRGQLGIDEARAAEVQRLLGLVSSHMRDQAGPLPVSKTWTASLELPVCMLGVVLPRDFSRFRSFVTWRDTLSHVLLVTLAQSVKEGWCESQPPRRQEQLQQQLQPQGSGGGTAQQLMARLKAALRRLDMRNADDFDEVEYRAASEAVRQQTHAIVQVLLSGLFDALDGAEYVPDRDRYLQVLETRIRPLLGITPSMHAAVLAWVHFRQYVLTQEPQLLAETRQLLYKLAAMSDGPEAGVKAAVGVSGSPGRAVGGTANSSSLQDAAFAKNVGQAVVDWILERLSDYHKRLDALGGPERISGLVDLLVFASTCRGASEEEIGRALLEAVSLSVAAELQRRMDAAAAAADGDAADHGSEARRCADVCRTAKTLVAEEHLWTKSFAAQLPEAFPVALSVLQEAAGAVLVPWLSTQPVLDEDTCEALRCALDLEPRLMTSIRMAAGGSCRYSCTARLFASVRPWNMPAQLQPLLSAWLEKQMSGFSLWVDRQLQQEDWRPLGVGQAHSASAREVRRIAMEALEALFGLQLPLPPSTVRQYMQGIAAMMTRYLDAILAQLGSETVMIPPTPHLTRYKREVAVKQEEAESQLPGMPTQQPAASATSRKGVHFADSVRRTEDEPCAARVSGLTTPVLVVMMASLAYLADTLQLLAGSVKQLRQQEQQARTSGTGSPLPAYPMEDGSTTAPAANPFMSEGGENPLADDIGYPDYPAAANSAGSFWNSSPQGSSTGGGSSSGPVWGASKPPLQQQQQASGGVQGKQGGWNWDAGGMGQGSAGGGGGFGTRDEQFGSLHDTGQKLRAGLAAVARWLAVRVVWWEQRAGWCELLYRHRVTSCRMDWLLDALATTLQENVSALPQQPQDLYCAVALELLQQAARALERALLDGGPCRWYIPADVDHLREDLEELRKLFFQANVPMQDIRGALLGLDGVLKLMAKQTGPLIDAHRAARRAALLAGPAAPSTPPPPGAAAPASNGLGMGAGSRTPTYATANSSSSSTQALGPLAAAKLAGSAAQGVSATAATAWAPDRGSGSGGGGSGGGSGGGFTHHSSNPTGGSTGSAFDDAASYSSFGSGNSPSWAASKAAGGGAAAGSSAATGAAGILAGVGCMRRTAQDVAAAGGDVEAQEPILLRVLCHRADHAASKYLKDNMKVSKARDEASVKETLKRGVTRFNPF